MRGRLFARKPITATAPAGMRAILGAWELTLLGVGAIVGTGIFVLSGEVAAAHAGPAITCSFALAGLAALLAGLCYSEVACMMPVSGSAYAYAYAALGEGVAWLVGWDLLLEYLLAAASVAVGWSAYVVAFCRNSLGWHVPAAWSSAPLHYDAAARAIRLTGAWLNVPAAAAVLILTALLASGIKQSARFNACTVAVKIIIIGLFIACASRGIVWSHYQPYVPPNTGTFGAFGWSGVLQGASILFFAYNGFDAIATAAQEAREPQRDIPRSIMASLAIAALLYMGVAAVLTGVVPYADLRVAHPMSVGIERAGVTWLQPLVDLGAIAGLTSVMLVNLLSQPRIAYAMACDGLLPPVLGRLHPRTHVPVGATWLGGIVCAVAAALVPVDVLGELMCVGTLFAFFTVSIGVIVLRRTHPHVPRRFSVPGGALGLPLVAALGCVALLAMARRDALWRFGQWMALGCIVYGAYGYRRRRA